MRDHLFSRFQLQSLLDTGGLGTLASFRVLPDKFEDCPEAYEIRMTNPAPDGIVILRIERPFRIGGGIHLQILLPLARQILGECALLVAHDEKGKMTLPRMELDGHYWAIFRSVDTHTAQTEEVFTAYRHGHPVQMRATLDEHGAVQGLAEERLADTEYLVFSQRQPKPRVI